MTGEAQGVKILDRSLRVKNTHHHFFTKGGGQGRDAHLDFIALGIARLDAAILRAAPLHHIHASQQFDARRHRIEDANRHLIDRVQHAVNAKTDHALLAPRLQVNIAGALVKSVLPEPVHHLHHALVIGVDLLVALAQFHQLLKTGTAAVAARLVSGLDRFRESEKFGGVALNLQRTGQHPAHRAARLALHFGDPVDDEGFRHSHHQFSRADQHWQDLVALGKSCAHGVSHLADIDLERVDAQVVESGAPGQPLREQLDVECLVVAGTAHRNTGQAQQRMLHALGLRATRRDALRFLCADDLIELQPLDQAAPIKRSAEIDSAGGFGTHSVAHVSIGLKVRTHLVAGRPHSVWMISARGINTSRRGRLGVR